MMRDRCRQISLDDRQIAAKKASELFIHSDLFKNNQNIACYIANDYEIDTTPIINAIWKAKKNCYLPIVHPNKKSLLLFQKFTPQDPLILNRFNIVEPIQDKAKQLLPEQLDLVLMPLNAFDKKGNRVGKGSGYYDKTFSFKKNHQKPTLCGLAYSIQEMPQIKSSAWDIFMDVILTEKNLDPFLIGQ